MSQNEAFLAIGYAFKRIISDFKLRGYSNIKQKACERDLSREIPLWIYMKTL